MRLVVDCKYRNMTTESMCELDDCLFLDDSFAKISSRRDCHRDMDLIFQIPYLVVYQSLLMCFGLLTLQGSQPAIAGTDIGSGLQSIPFLGTLVILAQALLAAGNSAAIVFAGTFGALAYVILVHGDLDVLCIP